MVASSGNSATERAIRPESNGASHQSERSGILRMRTVRGSAPAKMAAHVPGEPGVWILLFGDLLVFTALLIAYLLARARHTEIFTSSQEHLSRGIGVGYTTLLLTGSLCVALALAALRRGRRKLAVLLTLSGAATGVVFALVKMVEYYEKFCDGISPARNDFWMYYFALTGLHLVHVILGVTVLVVLARLSWMADSAQRIMMLFESGACFWHLVDLLWLLIFPLLFLVR